MTATINLPRILRVGAGASSQLVETLRELAVGNPLLVTDPFMVEYGYAAALEQQLQGAKISYAVFADSVPDPTTDSVDAALGVLHQGGHDAVVALGGGSSIDTAKAVAAMALREGPMRE